ncbi:uncharacterized protein LOC114960007 [Acropora millepora]|uniref:uncharacterized protein LOC114960007 n=1 Tax=Acropora millepora TaxID=45264 RepID=UPI0010FCD688|nr:uncharacterized protein LOC114960007 [Acropora millepora]
MACNFHLTKCLVVCLVVMTAVDSKAGDSCKTNEINGPSGVCHRLCGDMFKAAFELVCFSQHKREQDVAGSEAFFAKYGLQKTDANQFLSRSVRSQISRRSQRQRATAVEECCTEQCSLEEVMEYCP